MTNLVSRIACFGRLKHRPVGYSGPLDRQLLSYSYMITAVRSSLRDLVETILVSMFLTHDAERERNDYHKLATRSVNNKSTNVYRTLTIASLPFINDNGYGLAIATRTYLDAINKDGVQPTDKLKSQIKAQEEPYTWFQFVPNLSKNLDNAFKLWDAVGVVLIPTL
jgi:Temperature dependent protein affecting M2 dsRNA replication